MPAEQSLLNNQIFVGCTFSNSQKVKVNFAGDIPSVAQPAYAADRFAREITRILTVFVLRSRRLNGNPFGRSSKSTPLRPSSPKIGSHMNSRDPRHIPTKHARRFALLAGTSGCLLIAALIGIGHALNRRRLPATPADAALVFGTGLPWKALARINTAAQLFHQARVQYLIVSGGVLVPGTTLTEASFFRDALVGRGVPNERILRESQATNTAENASYALAIIQAQHFQRVVLVMSDFEGLRAHLTAKRAWHDQGLTIFDYYAPSSGHWNAWTWWLSREGWSLSWYTVSRLFRYRLWNVV